MCRGKKMEERKSQKRREDAKVRTREAYGHKPKKTKPKKSKLKKPKSPPVRLIKAEEERMGFRLFEGQNGRFFGEYVRY